MHTTANRKSIESPERWLTVSTNVLSQDEMQRRLLMSWLTQRQHSFEQDKPIKERQRYDEKDANVNDIPQSQPCESSPASAIWTGRRESNRHDSGRAQHGLSEVKWDLCTPSWLAKNLAMPGLKGSSDAE
jgi:hypothetical protein